MKLLRDVALERVDPKRRRRDPGEAEHVVGDDNIGFAEDGIGPCPMLHAAQSIVLAPLAREATEIGLRTRVPALEDTPFAGATELLVLKSTWLEATLSDHQRLCCTSGGNRLAGICRIRTSPSLGVDCGYAPGYRPFELALAPRHGGDGARVIGIDGHPLWPTVPSANGPSGEAVRALDLDEGAGVAEVAKRLGVAAAAIKKSVDALVEGGRLVERKKRPRMVAVVGDS